MSGKGNRTGLSHHALCVLFTLRANWVQEAGYLHKKRGVVLASVDEIPTFGEIQSLHVDNGEDIVVT